jgi:hypothetical protein
VLLMITIKMTLQPIVSNQLIRLCNTTITMNQTCQPRNRPWTLTSGTATITNTVLRGCNWIGSRYNCDTKMDCLLMELVVLLMKLAGEIMHSNHLCHGGNITECEDSTIQTLTAIATVPEGYSIVW